MLTSIHFLSPFPFPLSSSQFFYLALALYHRCAPPHFPRNLGQEFMGYHFLAQSWSRIQEILTNLGQDFMQSLSPDRPWWRLIRRILRRITRELLEMAAIIRIMLGWEMVVPSPGEMGLQKRFRSSQIDFIAWCDAFMHYQSMNWVEFNHRGLRCVTEWYTRFCQLSSWFDGLVGSALVGYYRFHLKIRPSSIATLIFSKCFLFLSILI